MKLDLKLQHKPDFSVNARGVSRKRILLVTRRRSPMGPEDRTTGGRRLYAALRILWIRGAIFLKSSTNDCICSCRDWSSIARRIDDGCTVAMTCGARGDSTRSPCCRITLKSLPGKACAAVAPRHTRTSGLP